jgi:hypothetical protein
MAFLEEPLLRGVPPGSLRFFELQRRIIQERPLMRAVYERWYHLLLEDESTVPGDPGAGELLELGSGGSTLKQLCPRVVTSDVEAGVAELTIDGRELPFADGTQPYDDAMPGWRFDQTDAMRDANQALTWIVFERDRELFRRRFPRLTLERTDWLPWFSYVLSGGVTRRNLVPAPLVPWVGAADRLLSPLDRWMALHWHLRVRKRE